MTVRRTGFSLFAGGGALLPAVWLGLALATTAAGAADAPKAEADGRSLTFNKDIAPLVFQRCASCHRSGEVAPFPLLSYRDVSKRANLIRSVVRERVMPPWKAEPDFGHFVDDRRLSDEQIALVSRWIDEGMPEGDPADLPALPRFTEGWQLGEPDMVVTMAEPYTLAAEGRDDYRCFVIPFQPPPGKYLRAVEYRPGNRRIVHHAVLTTLPHKTALAKLAEGDGDGKSFGSGLAPPGQLLPGPMAFWTPGMQPRFLPEGTALDWPGGSDLVLQLHLHPSGKPETEQTAIGLHFTDQPPRRRMRMLVMSNNKIDIPPGVSEHVIQTSLTLREPAEVYGVFPHMHLLGRTVMVTATLPDGTVEPLIAINDWDFNWQHYYEYAEHLKLPAGTRLEGRWTYDNSAGNPANPSQPPERVTYGEQTRNEMAILAINVITDRTAPAGRPAASGGMAARSVEQRAAELLQKADRDKNGKLSLEELRLLAGDPEAAEGLPRKAAQFDRDGDKELSPPELVEALKSSQP